MTSTIQTLGITTSKIGKCNSCLNLATYATQHKKVALLSLNI